MYFVLIATLLIILCFNYNSNNKEICCPSFIFTFSFLLLAFAGLTHYSEVDYETLSFFTVLVIILGVLSFDFGVLIIKVFNQKKTRNCDYYKRNLFKQISNKKLLIFLAFQIVTAYLTFKGILSFDELGEIRNETVNSSIGYYSKSISFLNAISFMSGIIFSIYLARIMTGYSTNLFSIILLLLNLLLSLIISLAGGSRGTLIIILTSLGFNYLLFYLRANNWKKNIPLKSIIIVLFLSYFLLFAFKELSYLMGQKQVSSFSLSQYIFIYVGAQLKNLDMALSTHGIIGRSDVFGQETFRSFVNLFSNLFGSGLYSEYKLYLPFNYYSGISMGNVYTTFFPYLLDFGFPGVIVCSALMGSISQRLYIKTKNYLNKIDGISIWNVLWSYTSFCLAFSFFSNKFYENIITVSIIKYIICTGIVLLFFFGSPITKDGKLKIVAI